MKSYYFLFSIVHNFFTFTIFTIRYNAKTYGHFSNNVIHTTVILTVTIIRVNRMLSETDRSLTNL